MRIRFDAFELRTDSNELFKGGSKLKLKPQAARVLAILAKRPGEPVSREEIRKALWGADTFVDFDASLNSCIMQLRSALGDDPEAPRFIETVPRHGYRFVAPLAPPAPVVSAPPRARLPFVGLVLAIGALASIFWNGKPEDRAMLLVRPFENLSGDDAEDFIAAGLTEEIITRAAGIHPEKLGVYAPSTASRFDRGELDPEYVLEGSFRREGDRIRITARLVDGREGATLWSESYDRSSARLLEIQEDVAARIAQSLVPDAGPKVQPFSGSTSSPEAHAAYLEGRQRLAEMNLSSLRLALAAFERAVAVDPRYARAWAGLADAANFLSWFGGLPSEESARRGREAAEKALEIAPSLAEAHDALGFVLFYHDFDLAGAEARFQRALALQPGLAMSHYWYAGLLSALGRHEEAIARIRAAQELDPLSPLVNADAGWYYFYARRYADAIRECERIVRIDPEYAWAHQCIVAAARKGGREAEALESRKELARLQQRMPAAAPRYASPYALALKRLNLGDRAGSLDALEEAYEERDPFLVNAGVDPRLDELHGEPRFRRLLLSLFEGSDVPCLPDPDGPPCAAPRAARTRSGR